jgi:hypothetical protein
MSNKVWRCSTRSGVATVSGELDPFSTGIVYCELVCALQGLAQYDVAEEWTEAMERWCETNAIGSLHVRCRVHRAEILRRNRELMNEIIARHTGQLMERVSKDTDRDFILTADQAVEYGAVDEIITSRKIRPELAVAVAGSL